MEQNEQHLPQTEGAADGRGSQLDVRPEAARGKDAAQWSNFYLKDVTFTNLMLRHVFNVLIVANPYDAFMLEDDGRVEEKIYNEYRELGLRFAPAFTKASTTTEALEILRRGHVDLVICMPGNADNDAFSVAREIKAQFPKIHYVVLTPFSHGITRRMQNEDLSMFDYVFCWLGNTNLILSIIKLLEDRMNVENDTKKGGVQLILLVEDNIRFYSSILTSLYGYLLSQSKNFSHEALNAHAASLRKRGRPKVILARTYEEAMDIYSKYKDNTLGVISDGSFPVNGVKDEEAGLRLLEYIRSQDEFLPLILESSDTSNREKAAKRGFWFVDKNSKTMDLDLRHILEEHMGFGDFIFRDPTTHEPVMRVGSLKELQDNIFKIPRESMLYHISRNHVSRWLTARAIFPVAEFLKHITWHKLQDVDAHRQIIFDAIVEYRRMKNIGVVAEFDRMKFDRYAHFARIGDGSLGGKARGLAFLDNIIKLHPELNHFDNTVVQIPKTLVLCTDIFDQFMENNDLYAIAMSDSSDDEILQAFLAAQLPDDFIDDFMTFIDATRCPLAIRSSSLLEDSHYQPFAGIYSTYMIPYVPDHNDMLRMIAAAVKGVYASVFYASSKAYMKATRNVIDQEKMAVILQEVVGKAYGTHYYPNMSGVLRSLNFYPVGDEKTEEGVASLALGLGKYIVDGGRTLRISPSHPQRVLQMSDISIALRDTQTTFCALDLAATTAPVTVDDGANLLRLKVRDAEKDGSLAFLASTYDADDQIIREGLYDNGRKIISFAGLLSNSCIPFAALLRQVMRRCTEAMRRPVEIEFACNIIDGNTLAFHPLQIRPIADAVKLSDGNEDDLHVVPDGCVTVVRSNSSLGHGVINDVCDIVYVKMGEEYTPAENPEIALEIEQLNKLFLAQDKGYVLIGPGRWGSSDPWLGVPVKWSAVSAVRTMVEVQMPSRYVEPSQGTHFFQNLTTFGVGCLSVNAADPQSGLCDFAFMDSMPAENETAHLRQIHFDKPVRIVMNAMERRAVIYASV